MQWPFPTDVTEYHKLFDTESHSENIYKKHNQIYANYVYDNIKNVETKLTIFLIIILIMFIYLSFWNNV